MRLLQYDATHVIAGDTDSSYVSLDSIFKPDASVDDVVSYANNLGIKVNQSFPRFMQRVFNVGENRMSFNGEQVIVTDREVVADKALFKAKKNYMMHLVDKDGKRIDKNKITGLEIIKADTPGCVQDFLLKAVLSIVDGADYETIRDMIAEFKSEYHEKTFQEIGRPMSVKVLKKCEDEYKTSGTMKGFSYHVRAAMFYNSLCGPNDIRIRSGDKIAICYIDHPDSKYIAVPIDADVLPDFVADMSVDWKTQWKTVEKKIGNYLKSLGWDIQSRQEDVLNQFIE